MFLSKKQIVNLKLLEGEQNSYKALTFHPGPMGIFNPRKLILELWTLEQIQGPEVSDIIVDGTSCLPLVPATISWAEFADIKQNDTKLPLITKSIEIWIKFHDPCILLGRLLGTRIR